MFKIDDRIVSKSGKIGRVVKIPDDYSFASKDDPFTMARLIFVEFDGEEAILVPESRFGSIRE